MMPPEAEREVLRATRHWLDRAVIELNLCPFAKAVRRRRQIRFIVSAARTRTALTEDLAREARHLADADPARLDTTLLIHPLVLNRFADYNDFLDVAEALLDRLQLRGVLQIASFHPHYRFAGAAPGDMANWTNRSPYPLLHLLREASVGRAATTAAEAEEIVERNIQTLRRLGREGWKRQMHQP